MRRVREEMEEHLQKIEREREELQEEIRALQHARDQSLLQAESDKQKVKTMMTSLLYQWIYGCWLCTCTDLETELMQINAYFLLWNMCLWLCRLSP